MNENIQQTPNRLVPPEFSTTINPLISQFRSTSACEIRRLEQRGLSTVQAIDSILHKLSRISFDDFLEEEILLTMEITGLNKQEALRVLLMREELYNLRTRGLDTLDAIQVLLARVKEAGLSPPFAPPGSKRDALSDKFRKKKRIRHGISTLSSSLSSSISDRLHFPVINSGFPSNSSPASTLFQQFTSSNLTNASSPPLQTRESDVYYLSTTDQEFIFDPLFSPSQPEEPKSPESSEGSFDGRPSSNEQEPLSPSCAPSISSGRFLNTSTDGMGTDQDTSFDEIESLQVKMERLVSFRQIRLERKSRREGKKTTNDANGISRRGNSHLNVDEIGLRPVCLKRVHGLIGSEEKPQKRQHLGGRERIGSE